MSSSKKKTGSAKLPGTFDTTEADKATPKSVIIYRGEVGNNVRALMHDWRAVFLPWSSKRLHGKNKSLKDFMNIASIFSISHLQLFTAPSNGTSLRIMRFSNGPTLSFRVLSYTLRHELMAQATEAHRRLTSLDHACYEVAPIVLLNNFAGSAGHPPEPEVGLMEATFRSMFPTINVQLVRNSDIQRVCLFHYDPTERIIEVRHYYIGAKAVGLSKTVKKLLEGRRPSKLGTLENVEEVLEREGVWSDSDGEGEEVPLVRPFRNHREQCRVKLQEIGPRLTLQLIKVENGFAGGEVIYHHHVVKTTREVQENAHKVRSRRVEKMKRKADQDKNVQRKRDRDTERTEKRKERRMVAERAQKENPLEIAGQEDDE